ncbi:MAG: hypothetical protein IT423_11975 [Pirellulaceae bacterium]|nr:hypothetical protein [Pirellulaceae bacterium]
MASDIPGVDASPVGRSNLALVSGLLMGLLAGGVVFALISSVNPIFTVPDEYHIQGLGESAERWQAFQEQQFYANQKNAAVFLGVLGGLLAIVVTIRSHSSWSLMKRLVVCVPIGVVAGVVAGFVSAILQARFNSQGPIELPQSTAIYATMFGLLGAGLGLGVGLSFGSPFNQKVFVERLATGLIMGAVAGAAYPLISSILVPSANIEALFPANAASLAICLGLASAVLAMAVPVSRGVSKGTAQAAS